MITFEEKVNLYKEILFKKDESFEEWYNRLYNSCKNKIKEYNPCQWQNKKCEFQRICNKETIFKPHPETVCCGNCKYASINGCTTENLACAVWFCTKASNSFYNKYEDIRHFFWLIQTRILMHFEHPLYINLHFISKKEYFKLAKSEKNKNFIKETNEFINEKLEYLYQSERIIENVFH